MANHEYKILSEDAIKYLCGLIRDLASVSEGIDNLNLADDKTFSNIYIKNLIDKCLEDANAEAEKLVGALTHLTCKETAIRPTLDNSKINVIYLYSADGNPPYQQFLKISEYKLVDLGSTSISLEDYIKAADVAKDYATKVELKAVTDKIGTTTLTTTDTTITGAIEEVKGIADGKVDKTSIVTALGDSVTDDQVTSALLAKTELGKINANLGELSQLKTETKTDLVSAINEIKVHEIITGERLIVTCNNQGADTIVGRITLPKGLWIINCGGYSPLGLLEHNTTSKIRIGQSQSWRAMQNLSYAFNLVTIISLNEETTVDVIVTNWESEPSQSTTNWSISAYRI